MITMTLSRANGKVSGKLPRTCPLEKDLIPVLLIRRSAGDIDLTRLVSRNFLIISPDKLLEVKENGRTEGIAF